MKKKRIEAKFDKKIKNTPLRFINRELSWLNFNERVLSESQNQKNPLLERLRFLSISGNNLDEFHMVRVAGLWRQIKQKVFNRTADGLTTRQQFNEVSKSLKVLLKKQQSSWKVLKKKLESVKVKLLETTSELKKEEKEIQEIFKKKIFPSLTLLAIDPAHPFPFLPNRSITMVCSLKNQRGKVSYSLVIFPPKLQRFFKLSSKNCWVKSEDIIKKNFDLMFGDFELQAFTLIRIIRDSDIEFEEEAEDLILSFETALKKRRRGTVVGLYIQGRVEKKLLSFIKKSLNVDEERIFRFLSLIDINALNEIVEQGEQKLKFKKFKPRFPKRIDDFNGDCFSAIRNKDLVIHHPFETFDVVVKFLEQAAFDENVLSIKQTLYRTSDNSPIVKALINASNLGKSVTAVVELKARFDEEKNIKWSKDLEKAGVNIVYGFVRWKTHAKISLITRKEQNKVNSYAHFGTGNYHPITAKVYSDLSIFSCDTRLVEDALNLFNFITGYTKPKNMHLLSYSPILLRQKLVSLIDTEISNKKKGLPAEIWIKVNSLIDSEIIDRLYNASQNGVKIKLIVRGICGLRPGIKGFSENIKVKSVIGRFLEHSRIFCFSNGNDMPSSKNSVFISSADLMTRNIDRRVEAFIPVINETVHEQILKQIMITYLKDNVNSWTLNPNGTYKKKVSKSKPFSAFQYFIKNPSLSGRGSKVMKKNIDTRY